MGKINDKFELESEIHNFYPGKNEKLITPGNNSLLDYLGGVTAGQNNYRPTYNLILYGVNQKTLDMIREG